LQNIFLLIGNLNVNVLKRIELWIDGEFDQ